MPFEKIKKWVTKKPPEIGVIGVHLEVIFILPPILVGQTFGLYRLMFLAIQQT